VSRVGSITPQAADPNAQPPSTLIKFDYRNPLVKFDYRRPLVNLDYCWLVVKFDYRDVLVKHDYDSHQATGCPRGQPLTRLFEPTAVRAGDRRSGRPATTDRPSERTFK
jgi:hypothetical protein